MTSVKNQWDSGVTAAAADLKSAVRNGRVGSIPTFPTKQ